MTTDDECRFTEMVAKGATVFCSQDMYDEFAKRGYADHVELCKYLSPGTLLAADLDQLEKYAAIPLTIEPITFGGFQPGSVRFIGRKNPVGLGQGVYQVEHQFEVAPTPDHIVRKPIQ